MSAYVNLERLEFEVTYRCNSRCKHCTVGDEKRHTYPAAIDRDLAVEAVRKVSQSYRLESVMTFGGEPLLYPDIVCAIHGAARDCGIPKRQILTNAGSPRTNPQSREVAAKIADAGVNSIAISVDCFHQEHVDLGTVESNVTAYAEARFAKLAWNPAWVVSKTHDNPYNERTRAILKALAHLPVELGDGNIVQPEGNAKKWLQSYMPLRTPSPAGSCEDYPYGQNPGAVTCISIEPDGDVAICWDWVIGNASRQDIRGILAMYDPLAKPEARALLEGGLAALADMCRARGAELDPDGYYSACDMCRSLRTQLLQ